MRQIEGAFNVKISVPKKGSNDRVITIKGPEEQISNAKRMKEIVLPQLVSELNAHLFQNAFWTLRNEATPFR